MASKRQYQGQGLLDFSEEQESDTVCSSSSPSDKIEPWTYVEKSDLHGSLSVSPGGEKTLSAETTASNVERRRTQLREAQRKHRQRRQEQMEDLQTQVVRLQDQLRQTERDKAMLYNILQRVLGQMETQRQAITSDLPQLIERSVAAHLNSPSPTAVPAVTAAGGQEYWAHSPVSNQFSYGQPGGSPMMGYEMQQPTRLQVPTTMATGMPGSAGSASPYDAPYQWPANTDPEGLWLNEEESRLLGSFGQVSRA